MKIRVIAMAAVLIAALAWAGAPKRHIVGKGGFNPHEHGSDQGNETISLQVDVVEGSPTGWIVLAGDVHSEGEGHDHTGGPFPHTYMKMERLNVAKIEKKMITIEGIGHVNDTPAKIGLTIEDGKLKGKDHIHVHAVAMDGEELLVTHGYMVLGDIKIKQGAQK